MGFWPAAALLPVLLGSVIVGLLLDFTLQCTGNLWSAIGIHAAWDWAKSFAAWDCPGDYRRIGLV